MKKILLAFSAFILLFSCNSNNGEDTPEEKVRVKTRRVEVVDHTYQVRTSGRVASRKELRLSFKTGGVIKHVYVNEGMEVEKGDLLASLDLEEVKAKLKQARLGLEKAKRDYQRAKNLYEDSVGTLETLQNAKTSLDIAKTKVQIAGFNLRKSSIKAPADGIILRKMAHEEEIVNAGYPVILFGSHDKNWIVRTSVTDNDRVKVQMGDSAQIYLDPYPDKSFKGVVTEIGSGADPYTGTYELEIRLNPVDEEMVSGFIAKVNIFTSTTERFFQIPVDALAEADEKEGYVYLIENGKPIRKRIEIGKILGDDLLVKEGLTAGDQVITRGAKYVKTGTPVIIQNP